MRGYPKQCSTSKYHSNWYPPILPTINKHDSTGGFGVSPGFTVLLSMPWHHSSGLQEASLKPRRVAIHQEEFLVSRQRHWRQFRDGILENLDILLSVSLSHFSHVWEFWRKNGDLEQFLEKNHADEKRVSLLTFFKLRHHHHVFDTQKNSTSLRHQWSRNFHQQGQDLTLQVKPGEALGNELTHRGPASDTLW